MNPLIQLKKTTPLFLIALVLVCFGLLPIAQAVVPPPDGGYPNFNTAEGQNALFSLTTGTANTAVGWFSLYSDTHGQLQHRYWRGALLFNTADDNTAIGAAALLFNTTGSDNTAVGTTALLNNTDCRGKHGHWSVRPFQQHRRRLQHGHWSFCARWQHHWRAEHAQIVV